MTASTAPATTRQYDFLYDLCRRTGHVSPNQAAVDLGIRRSLKSIQRSGLSKADASRLIEALKVAH